MTAYLESPFPEKPFFSCSPSELQVIDQAKMGEMLRGGSVVPWMRFLVGEGNILESEPVKATSADGRTVQVVCGDATVEIDFFDETARRTGSDGVLMMYMGGLDEANAGRGWIPAR
ncbi:MAG: hypothetical protein IIB28_03555 [Chloroflexi bacterium]|nr:hypothetical protein [Chloroflexota bacterium]